MSMEILMPALSPTMEEGKLSKWLVKEGDEVHSGDILAEIETDKATMEFGAVDEGKIGKLLVPEGTEGVKVNQPIAELLQDGEAAGKASAPAASAEKSRAEETKQEIPPQKGEGRTSEAGSGRGPTPAAEKTPTRATESRDLPLSGGGKIEPE